MLKYIVVALLSLELILFSSVFFAPAHATENDPSFYLWDYASVGKTQVVCKQMVIHPEDRPLPADVAMQAASIRSNVVDDHYCDAITKPAA